MSRIYRSLLGFSVAALLVPTIAITVSGFFDRDQPETGRESLEALQDDDVRREHSATDDLTTTTTASQLASDSIPERDRDKDPPGATTDETTADSPHADHAPDTSSQQAATTKSDSGSDGPSTTPTGEVITGNDCPCTVTGTATLQGRINLQGDVIVVSAI